MNDTEEMKPVLVVADLKGLTLSRIEGGSQGSESIIFTTVNDRSFELYHDRDCCECVQIEDICGDIDDLIGTPILLAEEACSERTDSDSGLGSSTWTFYKLATIKGHVTIRWLGTSNGYYSESVDFREL